MLTYPEIDPVAFSVGSFSVRWYGISYVVGILLAWQLCAFLVQKYDFGFKRKVVDDFIPLATIGIVLGGRIGNALFYHLDYYLSHPWEIFYIWQPGMSFHGGFWGVVLTLILFCRYHKLHFFSLADVLAVGTPIGIFFGRLANFVNAELYGRVTEVPWGMVFPTADNLPRHPSQLYEAGLEGVLLFTILICVATLSQAPRRPGLLSAVFLIGYGAARSVAEIFRDPDGVLSLFGLEVTLGQAYSIPLVLVGVCLLWKVLTRPGSLAPQTSKKR